MYPSIEQHNIEIQQNRAYWEKKTVLHKVYSEFYREIAQRLKPELPGLIVELGSGMAKIKEQIPQCITTDIFANPWLDGVEDAYHLSFEQGAVSHLILFDVWHHLRFPGTALQEFSRVLAEGGRVIILDPAMGLIGRFVFGHFHHEPLGLDEEIEWRCPKGDSEQKCTYYAAQGNASRVFGSDVYQKELLPWRVSEVKYFSGLAYVASGGFRGPQLYPSALWPVMSGLDTVLSRIPALASRMLVVLERSDRE